MAKVEYSARLVLMKRVARWRSAQSSCLTLKLLLPGLLPSYFLCILPARVLSILNSTSTYIPRYACTGTCTSQVCSLTLSYTPSSVKLYNLAVNVPALLITNIFPEEFDRNISIIRIVNRMISYRYYTCTP